MNYLINKGVTTNIRRTFKDVGRKSAALAPLCELPKDEKIKYISSASAIKVKEVYLNDDANSIFNLKNISR
jgi:hypothetical protein